MPVPLFVECTYGIVILCSIEFQLVIISHLITRAATEVKFLEIAEFVQYLQMLFHYLLFVFTTVDHQVISTAFAMDSMEHIVILCKFWRTIVVSAFAMIVVRMVATATFHTAMHPFFFHSLHKFVLLVIIEVADLSIFW